MGKFYDVASKERIIYSGCSSSPLHAISTADNKLCLYEEGSLLKPRNLTPLWELKVQGDQKVSVHLMITVQKNTQKYFKQFQSLTMIT
jgi:hypothetical protein